mmetsp:Transcript_11901/g.23729  ORF Transcript_11901/g.23729 Transcript_11901/m.23729 type:complete len:93 (+) Transcript_11901:480-758(+)
MIQPCLSAEARSQIHFTRGKELNKRELRSKLKASNKSIVVKEGLRREQIILIRSIFCVEQGNLESTQVFFIYFRNKAQLERVKSHICCALKL